MKKPQPKALAKYWAMKKGNHPSTDAMINETIRSNDAVGKPQQPNRQIESGDFGKYLKRSEIVNRHYPKGNNS